MTSWKKSAVVIAIASILIFTASWAFYRMVNEGAGELLSKLGIENVYWQSLSVILFVFLLLIVVGFGGKKALKGILKLS